MIPIKRKLVALIWIGSLVASESLGQVLDEVLVTARKRGESLMDTTYSVSAVSGEDLDKFGASNFNDVAETTPNLDISKAPTGIPTIVMRGVGTVATLNPFDLTVGLSIDGIFFANAQWFQSGLFDIQQVEVLRGPQGIDFGKNTTAGLINVSTRNPGVEWEGNFRIGSEQETKEKLLEAGISMPLTDYFAIRLAAQKRDNEGYQQTYLGENSPNLSRDLLRATALWTPTDSLSLSYKVSRSKFEEVGIGSELLQCDPNYLIFLRQLGGTDDCKGDDILYEGELIGGVAAQPIYRKGIHNSGKFGKLSSQVLGIEWALGDITLASTTGYQRVDTYSAVDSDFTDVQMIDTGFPDESTTFSQEFRASIPWSNRTSSVIGVYYETLDRDLGTLSDFRVPPPLGGLVLPSPLLDLLNSTPANDIGFSIRQKLETETETTAIFGDVTWDITDTLMLNAGLRYNVEKKKALLNQTVGDLRNPDSNVMAGKQIGTAIGRSDINNLQGSRKVEFLHPSVTLKWDYYTLLSDFIDAGQIYITYKEGYKSGGYDSISGVDANGEPAQPFEFEDETVKGYEVGTKIDAFNHRLRFSLSIFYSKYDDLQAQYLPSGQTVLITKNAGSAITKGVETDVQLALTESLQITAAYAYTDAYYDEYKDAPCYSGQSESQGCNDSIQDISGQPLANAPTRTGSLGLNYEKTLFDRILLNFGAQGSYSGARNFSPFGDPNTEVKALTTWNANIAFSDIKRLFTVAIIGRNLSNERDLVFKGSVPLSTLLPTTEEASYYGALRPPRTVAVELSLRF